MPDSDQPVVTCAPAVELAKSLEAAGVLLPLGAASALVSVRVAVLANTESAGTVAALAGDLPTATGAAVPDDDVDESAVGGAGTEADLGTTLHALTAASSAVAAAHRPRHCASL